MDAIADFIDSIDLIPDLPSFDLPSFDVPWSAPAPEASTFGASTQGSSGGSSGGGVTINVVGDPQTVERAVVKALRTYTRRNGRFVGDLQGIA
jgi:hypothetical protein